MQNYKNRNNDRFTSPKLNKQETLDKVNYLFNKYRIVKLNKNMFKEDVDTIINFLSEHNINLIEQDEKSLILGKE